MNKNIPAISVIIPMYNAEKYIGECLDSILAQTFQDFEVILIDNCSTDNSCAIVESYLPKFNRQELDKLRLIRREVNSGSAGTPRDIGISLSRGEYLSCIDSDDLITNTALEELYSIAKEFDADVVHCERFFKFHGDKESGALVDYRTEKISKEPVLITENIFERLIDLHRVRFYLPLWIKLIRRDFLFETGIKLVNVFAQDALCTYCLVLAAKNYVCVPNVVNLYRFRDDSLYHKKKSVSKNIEGHTKSIVTGFKYFNGFLNGIEFFRQRPDAKYFALELWIR